MGQIPLNIIDASNTKHKDIDVTDLIDSIISIYL